jgi:hypothetical protein
VILSHTDRKIVVFRRVEWPCLWLFSSVFLLCCCNHCLKETVAAGGFLANCLAERKIVVIRTNGMALFVDVFVVFSSLLL